MYVYIYIPICYIDFFYFSYKAATIHGDKSQYEREQVLRGKLHYVTRGNWTDRLGAEVMNNFGLWRSIVLEEKK